MNHEPATIATVEGDPALSPRPHTAAVSAGKRVGDVAASAILGVMLLPLASVLALLVWSSSGGPALYWSTRVGRGGQPFRMPKFRTMQVGAPEVATDKLAHPDDHTTRIGRILRKLSLDELPQLWSVFKGDMSLIGPRPALPSQATLNTTRQTLGVHALRPGITGWAQVNGRDDIAESRKIELDAEYLERHSLALDAQILWLTIWRVVRSEGVKH